MHFSAFVAAVLLPYAACRDVTVPPGGASCPSTCYGMSCVGAAALFAGLTGSEGATELSTWGCDCEGCDWDDLLDIETVADVPEDYACPASAFQDAFSCDDMAYLGFSCHYMETRRGADCTGCLCEEAILDYVKGDGSCPTTCLAGNCDNLAVHYQTSCENLETLDWVLGCDCSGCTTCDDLDAEALAGVEYSSMDCNGNGYWAMYDIGDETCGEEVGSFTMLMGNPDDGYEEQSWFVCLSCPELGCDGGDCGEEACGRDGSTCALPLCELCADDSTTGSQFGRSQYCTEDTYTCAPSPAPTTAAPTVDTTEATVAADEDGSVALTTTAVFAIALMLA